MAGSLARWLCNPFVRRALYPFQSFTFDKPLCNIFFPDKEVTAADVDWAALGQEFEEWSKYGVLAMPLSISHTAFRARGLALWSACSYTLHMSACSFVAIPSNIQCLVPPQHTRKSEAKSTFSAGQQRSFRGQGRSLARAYLRQGGGGRGRRAEGPRDPGATYGLSAASLASQRARGKRGAN